MSGARVHALALLLVGVLGVAAANAGPLQVNPAPSSGGGSGDITTVGSCTTGDCFSSAAADTGWIGLGASAGRITFGDAATDTITVNSASLICTGAASTQGIHSFGSAAQATISAAGAITTTGAVDFRSTISNGGSTACFGAVTGIPCFSETIGITTSSDATVSFFSSSATGIVGISYYDSGGTILGGPRFYNASVADADYANKMATVATSKTISEIWNNDAAAGTTVWEVRDNASATGAQLLSVDGAGNLFVNAAGTRTKGTITLAAGTGTATVASGSICVCSDTTAINAVQCSVTTTTLTANGAGTDVIAYHCL